MNQNAPLLIVENGQMAGQRWLMDTDVLIIGREPGVADLLLPERQVSRRHAKLERTAEGFVLTDLGSKNGTFLNGKEVKSPQLLRDGDEIQIALCVKIIFVGSDATAPLNAKPISKTMRPVVRGVRLDRQRRSVYVAEQELNPPLSAQQFRLLELLLEREGKVVTRDEICRHVRGEEPLPAITDQAVDALVRRLRERIAEIDPEHAYIVTVRGHGIRFENRY
ncbi:MAG: FHA domain-containing protein [Thermoflexales bacterium]